MEEDCECAEAGRPLACGRCTLPDWLRPKKDPEGCLPSGEPGATVPTQP